MAGIFILSACSGGGSYSSEKCAQLQEKVDGKQELTEDDYSEMINQLEGIVKILKEKDKEIGDDKEKKNEFSKSKEAKELVGYFFGFGFYLDGHGDQLSNSNKRKLNKIIEEYKDETNKD
ncbi:MAG: hypothetical protein K2M39_03495 [Muribaculaceae bacterium]|nr:hypothetical protein [Muribaculaceae bacterium]